MPSKRRASAQEEAAPSLPPRRPPVGGAMPRPEQAPPPFKLRFDCDRRRREARLLPPPVTQGGERRRVAGKRLMRLDMAEGASPYVAWDATLVGTSVQWLAAPGVWLEGRIVGFDPDHGTHRVRRLRPPKAAPQPPPPQTPEQASPAQQEF